MTPKTAPFTLKSVRPGTETLSSALGIYFDIHATILVSILSGLNLHFWRTTSHIFLSISIALNN